MLPGRGDADILSPERYFSGVLLIPSVVLDGIRKGVLRVLGALHGSIISLEFHLDKSEIFYNPHKLI